MSSTTCTACRTTFHQRLRHCLKNFKSQRRGLSSTRAIRAERTAFASNSQSYYWDTTPPTPEQLASASAFFRLHTPKKLWTATGWRRPNGSHDNLLVPEVAFLGRSNVGKSSLLNALLYTPLLNYVGPRPGKTTTMHAWGLSATNSATGGALKGQKGDMSTKLAVLDMPGYGHGSRDEWGEEIIVYLKRRKQLRRAFVLMDALHGIKASDISMLELLRAEGISHQIIVSKYDRVAGGRAEDTALREAMLGNLRNLAQPPNNKGKFVALGEILVTGSLGDGRKNDKVPPNKMLGVEEVQHAVLVAAGLRGTAGIDLPKIEPGLPEKSELPQVHLEHMTGKPIGIHLSQIPTTGPDVLFNQSPAHPNGQLPEPKPMFQGSVGRGLDDLLDMVTPKPRPQTRSPNAMFDQSQAVPKGQVIEPKPVYKSPVGRGIDELMAMVAPKADGANAHPSQGQPPKPSKPKRSNRRPVRPEWDPASVNTVIRNL